MTTPADETNVVWVAPFLNPSGYGEEARGFLGGLAQRYRIAARLWGDRSSEFVEGLKEAPALAREIHAALGRPLRKGSTVVLHMPAYAMVPVDGARRTVGRTMFETDSLPRDWVRACNELDELWVPTTFNAETFRRAGVRVPIHIVPGGVDTERFRPGITPLEVPGTRGTVFLSIFEWSYRKAPDVLLSAWARAFTRESPVSLVLRCYPRDRFDGGSDRLNALLDEQLASIGSNRDDVAPIVLIGQQLSPAAVPRLIAAANVFAGVSRGEGWGRPLLEAMSAGRAVIGTRWSGNLDFMDDTNSLLVDIDGLVPVDERMDVGSYRGHRWAEPSVSHLAELFRRAATDAALVERLGRKARADVEANWHWAKARRAADIRLQALQRAPQRRPGTGGRSVGKDPKLTPSPAAPATPLRVDWEGDFFQHHSLSLINQEICSRLMGSGIEVLVRALDRQLSASDPAAYARLARGLELGEQEPVVTVRHSWPPRLAPPPAGRWAHIQPWEFGGIPSAWINEMRHADEVWSYTSWVRDNYVASGLQPEKAYVVPVGVDPAVFTPGGPRYEFANQRDFRFLFVGGFIGRKGIDVLVKAYMKAFTHRDDVCLVLKGFGSDGVYANGMHDQIRALCSGPGLPAVELIEKDLSQAEMASLYRSCDVLVHPYRGEGFAMPVLEAMASGLPVAVTAGGATDDFCNDGTAWLLPSRRVTVPEIQGVGPSTLGYWMLEPDADYLAELMKELPSRRTESATRAAAAHGHVLPAYSWDSVARRVVERLQALADRPKGLREAGPGPVPGAGRGTHGKRHDRRPKASHSPKADRRISKPLLSACMIVKDEEQALPDCFASLHRVVDEVVVYDTGSTDRTVELARRAGARVVSGYWDDDFGRARNAALEQCRGEWILWVDADERLSCDDIPGLRSALGRLELLDALLVDIYNMAGDGSVLGGVHRAFRLFKRANCQWYGSLHEQVDLRPGLAETRIVQAAPLLGARIDHIGYTDQIVRERDKLERNLRLARAETTRKPREGQVGISQFNLARALAAAGHNEEARPEFEAALELVRWDTQRRAVLLHLLQNLATLGRHDELVSHACHLREISSDPAMANYFEAFAKRRLGNLDEALELLAGVKSLKTEDGFAFPEATLHAEHASALIDAGRNEEAVSVLLALVREHPSVLAMSVAMKVLSATGKPAEELAAAMPADRLNDVGAALVLVAPVVAAPVAEALYQRIGQRPQLLAAAIKFAPGLPTVEALKWSARLRSIGMDGPCPVVAQAEITVLEPRERLRAALAANAAFGDKRGAPLALALAAGIRVGELASAVKEVNALCPSLTALFARAAAGLGAPDAGDVGTPEARRAAVAGALASLGRPDLAELAAQMAPSVGAGEECEPVAQLAALTADRK